MEEYISKKSGIDLTQFWDQYLRTTQIPKLEYKYNLNQLTFRYVDIIEGFDMPVQLEINGKNKWIQPNADWQTFENIGDIKDCYVKQDFLIKTQLIE